MFPIICLATRGKDLMNMNLTVGKKCGVLQLYWHFSSEYQPPVKTEFCLTFWEGINKCSTSYQYSLLNNLFPTTISIAMTLV